MTGATAVAPPRPRPGAGPRCRSGRPARKAATQSRILEHVGEVLLAAPDHGRVASLLRKTIGAAFDALDQTVWLEDPAEPDALPAERPAAGGVPVDVVVPVCVDDRLAGLIRLGKRRDGRAYTPADRRLLRLLAGAAGLALGRADACRALREARDDLATAREHVRRLETVHSSLGKFVPRTVRALLEQGSGGAGLIRHEADVSVLFLDIVGSTRLSERLPAAAARALVERYFGAFLDEIAAHGGEVNEVAGDGVMVIFQDADAAGHARAAVRAALAVLRRARELNASPGSAEPAVALHAGVNSGPAVLGVTRIEGRVEARWTYTASGLTTNLAARLAEVGTGDAVIVGPATRARLGDEFACEPLGDLALRGVERAVPAWRVPVRPATPGSA